MFKLCKKSLLDVCFECGTPRSIRPAAASRESTLAVARDGRGGHKFAGDPLDAYIDAVVSVNAVKWKTGGLSSAPKKPPGRVQPTESVFESCDDPDRLIAYLRRCLDGHCTAGGTVLARFMRTMARRGRVDGLALIEELDARYGGHRRIDGSAMRMSLAEAYWTNGDLSRVFETLETFYPADSVKVHHVLEPIIGTVVRSRGVASVVMASKFASSVAAAHDDHHPMCVLWKHLFLSELYDDNAEAEKLMRGNGRLIEHVQYFVPAITNDALKKHRTDCVQRLMTVLLKHDRMKSYQWILRTLFEYHRECLC